MGACCLGKGAPAPREVVDAGDRRAGVGGGGGRLLAPALTLEARLSAGRGELRWERRVVGP